MDVIFIGKFYTRIDNIHDLNSFNFLKLLIAFNLFQRVSPPTYNSGHFFYLIISNASSNIVSTP